MGKGRSIGEVLKELREEKGLTLSELAKRSGGTISFDWIANAENKGLKKIPEKEILDGLALSLDMTVEEILERAGIIQGKAFNRLPPDKQKLVEMFSVLSDKDQKTVLKIIKSMVEGDDDRGSR